ncbi:ABC transporter ATP-binding protein [Rhodococcoides kyotonense]|uniref:ABC-2 type transport system ATP-binding protein n=1 Tax=Rhodococcoides kyotonense TaxID=398843 RepID=A0A239N6R3_9NOCA|nr:ABC transporter ATP-binding protein [Rhodococcus kyotonensis]SNT50134.1 ABC-2 type transport system ATP-binding protein [Rhodococcus kyotonensis]
MTETVLDASEVSKSFRGKTVLDACSFSLQRGSITALVGSNGAGKTTLMSVMVGLLKADSGAVTVLGSTVGERGIAPGLSYLAQHKPLFTRFTVAEILRFGRATNDRWDHAYASSIVDDAGVSLSSRVKTLSPGQRTRVAIALVLGRLPEIVLLDEPLADLDPVARRAVARTLMLDAAERGTTIVLSSHVLAELVDVADRLLLLRSGRMQLDGETEQIVNDHYVVTTAARFDASGGEIVGYTLGSKSNTYVVRGPRPAGSHVSPATLDDVVLAHLGEVS